MAAGRLQEGHCGPLEWAAFATAYPGQLRSGDNFLVQETEGGVLVGVVDGLGHGEEAADVAERALASLRMTAGQSLTRAVTACHGTLRGSRGVVMTLALLDLVGYRLTWVAVGNVDAAVLRSAWRGGPVDRRSVPLRPGVLGDRLPPLREATVELARGDTLVVATDGISSASFDEVDLSLAPCTQVRRLHRGYARGDDDALVLVARCGG